MKTKVLTTLLVFGMVFQAASMGHPHNLFAARKQINAKRAAASQITEPGRPRTSSYLKATAFVTATVWNLIAKKVTK